MSSSPPELAALAISIASCEDLDKRNRTCVRRPATAAHVTSTRLAARGLNAESSDAHTPAPAVHAVHMQTGRLVAALADLEVLPELVPLLKLLFRDELEDEEAAGAELADL